MTEYVGGLMIDWNQDEIKATVFETLKVRKRLIKLNQTLSFVVVAKNDFDYDRYREVLSAYQTLHEEYSEVIQKVRALNPQIEVDSAVSLIPVVDQIHSQNYTNSHGDTILKALEQLDNMAQNLMLDLDVQCQERVEGIIAKRQ